ALPPVKSGRHSNEEGASASHRGADGKLSLADLEAKIQGLKEGDRRHWKDWQKIMDSVSPADIPQLLAALEKNPSKSTRDGLRVAFLSRWAESDPTSAMAYASAVPGKQSREQAILSVVRGWSEKDPAAA